MTASPTAKPKPNSTPLVAIVLLALVAFAIAVWISYEPTRPPMPAPAGSEAAPPAPSTPATVTNPARTTPQPTPDNATAGDWASMDADSRRAMAAHLLDFWQENGRGAGMTASDLAICITEEVIASDTPRTMLVGAMASRCVHK